MGYIISLQVTGNPDIDNGCPLTYTGVPFLWDFTPKRPDKLLPAIPSNLYIYKEPPKVLEIGCGDANWCFKVKDAYPGWIIEGLDDADHWTKALLGKTFKDFMKDDDVKEDAEYFSKVHVKQDNVEFTVRNINALISHSNPIPCNIYSFIRARDVFSKVESYKSFLEDIRCILQPEGVVELIEVDFRPRTSAAKCRRSTNAGHANHPQIDWTDKIQDRFKDPHDEQLATMVPEWSKRVEERHKATFRPRDGVPAANLKSWLEGAGFWDVKQVVLHLPVGGDTLAGKTLLDFIKHQTDLENCIPLLAQTLPQPNFTEIALGSFYINMHVVLGRKPRDPRPGDLLRDGTRQGMTTAAVSSSSSSSSSLVSFPRSRRDSWRDTQSSRRAVLAAHLAAMIDGQMHRTLSLLQEQGRQLDCQLDQRQESARTNE